MKILPRYKIPNTKYKILKILLASTLFLNLVKPVYAQETNVKDSTSRFADLVQDAKEFANALITGQLTVRGKAHFLSPIAADSAHILGDISQGGTLFITDGGKIENLAGDLQLQGSEKGGVVFGQDKAKISKEGNLTANEATITKLNIEEPTLQNPQTSADDQESTNTNQRELETNERQTKSSVSRELASSIGVDSRRSLGSATLPANKRYVTVQTTAVTENSKIFVTATQPTGGQSLFVPSQIAGNHFIVRIDNALDHNISFNWWVIN